MVGYKATALQPSLGERHPERTPPCAADGPVQKPRASSPPGPGAPHPPSGLVVLAHRSRPAVVAASGGRHALSLRADARGGAGHDAGGGLSCAPRDPAGRCAYTSYKVANILVEFSTSIPRTQLRPGYGDGFLGAPLHTVLPHDNPSPREQGGRRGTSSTHGRNEMDPPLCGSTVMSNRKSTRLNS